MSAAPIAHTPNAKLLSVQHSPGVRPLFVIHKVRKIDATTALCNGPAWGTGFSGENFFRKSHFTFITLRLG
jgi:hypothetical protein